MKKILFILLFLGFQTSFGQLFFNGSYSLDPIPYTYADAGTNSYTYSQPATGYGCGASFNYKFFRYDGYWYILETSVCGNYLRNRSQFKSYTPNPPCTAMWYSTFAGLNGVLWTPSLPVIAPNHPAVTSTAVPQLENIVGIACTIVTSVLSGTMTATYFLPPSLTTVDILAIVSPPTGALVWDITVGCLKVFNGTAWVCL